MAARISPAPLLCAVLNFAAAFVLAFLLAPGTPIVEDVAARERYIREHLVVWQDGWAVWMLAAASLLWCYAWWRDRVGASRAPLAIATAGITADWTAELLLILRAPEAYADVAPLAFFLTGAIANGLYTIAGIMLTRATPLDARARRYAAVMWSFGILLSIGAIAQLALLTALASAALFALFCPWCVWLSRRLA